MSRVLSRPPNPNVSGSGTPRPGWWALASALGALLAFGGPAGGVPNVPAAGGPSPAVAGFGRAGGPTTQPADPAPAPEKAQPDRPKVTATVEVCGLMIIGERGRAPRVPWFWGRPGTRLALRVAVAEGRLLSFDRGASRLQSLSDDAGMDLTRVDKKQGGAAIAIGGGLFGFGGHHRNFADEGRVCIVDVQAPRAPLPGTKELFAAGELVFLHASGKVKTFRHENVPVKMDTAVKAGRIPMEISKVADDERRGDGMRVGLRMDQDDAEIKAVRFLNAEGEAIECSGVGSSSRMQDNQVTMKEKQFYLAEKAKKVTIEVDYWMDVKVLKVPFALATGLGMPVAEGARAGGGD